MAGILIEQLVLEEAAALRGRVLLDGRLGERCCRPQPDVGAGIGADEDLGEAAVLIVRIVVRIEDVQLEADEIGHRVVVVGGACVQQKGERGFRAGVVDFLRLANAFQAAM